MNRGVGKWIDKWQKKKKLAKCGGYMDAHQKLFKVGCIWTLSWWSIEGKIQKMSNKNVNLGYHYTKWFHIIMQNFFHKSQLKQVSFSSLKSIIIYCLTIIDRFILH